MDVYLALYCRDRFEECYEAISVHKTREGADKAIEVHKEFVYDNADVFFGSRANKQLEICTWNVEKKPLDE